MIVLLVMLSENCKAFRKFFLRDKMFKDMICFSSMFVEKTAVRKISIAVENTFARKPVLKIVTPVLSWLKKFCLVTMSGQ